MQLFEHHKIREFLNTLVSHISFREAHDEIKREYIGHLEEAVQRSIASGSTREDAIDDALRSMGSPQEIGARLDAIHKPRFDFFVITAALCLLGLSLWLLADLGFATLQSVWILVGLFVAALFSLLPPSLIRSRATGIYASAAVLVIMAASFGTSYDGQPYLSLGPVHIKVVDVSVVLLLIANCGSLFRHRSPLQWVALVVPFFYFAWLDSAFNAALYFVGTLSLLFTARASWNWIANFTVSGAAGLFFTSPATAVLLESEFASLQQSESHTDFIFNSALSSNPVVAFLLVALLGLLVTRLVVVSTEVKSRYAAGILRLSSVVLAFSAAWAILAGIGYAPMPRAGIGLPLVSYGGSMMVAFLSLIGMSLGAARRKTLHWA